MTDERSRKRRRKRPLGARLRLTEIDDDTTSTLFATIEPSSPSSRDRAEEWTIDLRDAAEHRAPLPRRPVTHFHPARHSG
jgi:hypothetical protein